MNARVPGHTLSDNLTSCASGDDPPFPCRFQVPNMRSPSDVRMYSWNPLVLLPSSLNVTHCILPC